MIMIKAIIFDMDGVISDTQKLHSKVESEILSKFGINIDPEEITKRYAGVRTKEFMDVLLKQATVEYDIDNVLSEKWAQMEKYAASVEAIDGAIELIKKLSNANYPLAVASASNLNYVKNVLTALGVFEYFSAIVSGDMVGKGKPDPESFLLAASKLGVAPEYCLVIEDGASGMQAARDGGMACIGFVDDTTKEYPTHNLVTTLKELSLDNILAL